MKKKISVALILTFGIVGVALAAARYVVYYEDNFNGPLELVNRNTSNGSQAMTELRALNDIGCANDLGTVSSNYSADGTLSKNEAFIVAESPCAGMHLKSNANNYIRFSVGLNPTEKMRILMDGARIMNHGDVIFDVTNTMSNTTMSILSDRGNNGYVGTKTNHPTHIMAGYNARLTVYPDATVELWATSNCPTASISTRGGYLCVSADGSLYYKGSKGTVTLLGRP